MFEFLEKYIFPMEESQISVGRSTVVHYITTILSLHTIGIRVSHNNTTSRAAAQILN